MLRWSFPPNRLLLLAPNKSSKMSIASTLDIREGSSIFLFSPILIFAYLEKSAPNFLQGFGVKKWYSHFSLCPWKLWNTLTVVLAMAAAPSTNSKTPRLPKIQHPAATRQAASSAGLTLSVRSLEHSGRVRPHSCPGTSVKQVRGGGGHSRAATTAAANGTLGLQVSEVR